MKMFTVLIQKYIIEILLYDALVTILKVLRIFKVIHLYKYLGTFPSDLWIN